MTKAWEPLFPASEFRSRKPRRKGVTMILDKCHGLRASEDLLETAGDYVDHWKHSYGTSTFLDEDLLRRKIAMARESDMLVYPGGTLAECAILQGRCRDYMRHALALGFNAVEVSDGTIEHAPRARRDAMLFALDLGLTVVAEVGKKDPDRQPSLERLAEQALADFGAGAAWVIIEARESGRGVGVFDDEGSVVTDRVEKIAGLLKDHQDRLIWEAPFKNQQEYFILRFGPDVGLGNIPPRDVLSLEALRSGLRFETLRHWAQKAAHEREDSDKAMS